MAKRITDPDVAAVFAAYPPKFRRKLKALRALILDVAARTDGVGPLEETLKWGEPAYLTSASKSGTTVRIDWKKKAPDRYAMYFHCQTGLVDTFREAFDGELTFEGNRAIVFDADEDVPVEAVSFCIERALTYHLEKRSRREL